MSLAFQSDDQLREHLRRWKFATAARLSPPDVVAMLEEILRLWGELAAAERRGEVNGNGGWRQSWEQK